MVKQRVWVFYVISLCVVLLDQWSKQAVVAHFNYAQPYPVFSWLNITLLHNFGAAFSFLGGQGGWQIIFLAGLSLLMTIVVCVWLYRSSSQYVSLRCALSLILGNQTCSLAHFYDVFFFFSVQCLGCYPMKYYSHRYHRCRRKIYHVHWHHPLGTCHVAYKY